MLVGKWRKVSAAAWRFEQDFDPTSERPRCGVGPGGVAWRDAT